MSRCLPISALLALSASALAQTAEPAYIGRWAADAGDCAGNRYVWRFDRDRAALLIDNRVVPRPYRAQWRNDGETVSLAFGDEDGIKASYVLRFVGSDQFSVVRVASGGVERGLGPEITWKRCPRP